MDRVLVRRLQNEKEIFNVFFEFDQEITKEFIVGILVFINKYYPSYKIKEADWNERPLNQDWADFVLGDYTLVSEHDFLLTLNVPLYVQNSKNDELLLEICDEVILIYYGREESTNRNYLGIDFFGNVYTDIRYDWDNEKREDVAINQATAAKKNREIMSAFLKGLEVFLDADITEYLSPFYLDEKYIYKYGIKEDAILNYGQKI